MEYLLTLFKDPQLLEYAISGVGVLITGLGGAVYGLLQRAHGQQLKITSYIRSIELHDKEIEKKDGAIAELESELNKQDQQIEVLEGKLNSLTPISVPPTLNYYS